MLSTPNMHIKHVSKAREYKNTTSTRAHKYVKHASTPSTQVRQHANTPTTWTRKHAKHTKARSILFYSVKVRSNLTETALQNQQIGNIGFILGWNFWLTSHRRWTFLAYIKESIGKSRIRFSYFLW